MAKKKQKKESQKFEYSNEIIGVILILFSIIGMLGSGRAGNFIRSFAVFLVGIVWYWLLFAFLILGVYLIVKRKMPKMISRSAIGTYLIVMALLAFFHQEYVLQIKGTEVIIETFKTVMTAFKSPDVIKNCGGGMIGAILGYLFNWAFADGVTIVIVTLIVVGVILLFNTSILGIFKKIKLPKFRNKDRDNDNAEEVTVQGNSDTSEVVPDNRIVISSIEELTNKREDNKDDGKGIKEEEDLDIPIKRGDSKEEKDSLEEVKENIIKNTDYKLPSINILKTVKNVNSKENEINAKASIQKLEEILKVFEISGKIVQVNIGPTVTQYELDLKAGTKVNKLLGIQREIALAMAAKDVRIQAPIPGKNTIGIELPNKVNASVSFKEVLSNMPEVNEKSLLAVGLGKDIMGKVKWCEINSTPHLLVAGSTGSGKSVCINSMIVSILMRSKPDEVKLVLVDPKKVELSMYNGIPHLLTPVVTDPRKANIALKKIVTEMENRYDMFSDSGTKNIAGYNEYVEKENKNRDENHKIRKLPFIVVIIDELADLMLVAAKEVEDSILRITQMARAAGIHLIVATQRPSTDVITGIVKANIPSRISFAVSSSIDSRTILDMTGAEKLLGKGDMLFLPMGENTPIRIQGAFVSDDEINKVIDYTVSQQKAQYDEKFNTTDSATQMHNDGDSEEEYDDPLYNDIREFVIRSGKASASLLQRKYKLGYNRAARIMDLLEERGIVGPQNGSKPREVLVKLEEKGDE